VRPTWGMTPDLPDVFPSRIDGLILAVLGVFVALLMYSIRPPVPCEGDLDCAIKNPGQCEQGGTHCLTDAQAQAILDRMTPADREAALYGNTGIADHVRRADCADEVVHRADFYTPTGGAR
jgi:hypothetical protein